MNEHNWNLKDLYQNDDELSTSIKETLKKANEFNITYKGKLGNISSIESIVSEYEDILEAISKAVTYAFLKFAVDSNEGAFYAKAEKDYTKVVEELLFFENEFTKLDDASDLANSSEKYKYYLDNLLLHKKYQLTTNEEKIMLKKSMTSSSAFSRLFDEIFSDLKFEFDGKSLGEEEVLSKLHSDNRDTRKKANASLAKVLNKNSKVLKYIFNMIKADLKTNSEIRGYENVETSRHISNQISQQSVDALINTTNKNFDISIKYYEIKNKILGYDKLYDYDRYAPIVSEGKEYTYEESRKIVLNAFKSFDNEMYEIALKAIDEGWCDVYPKESKRGGAFSHPATTDTHPYVLLNHTDGRRDLFTLAHELGHAIHQYLSRQVGYLNSDTPLTTSESASVFAEMLVFDYLIQNSDDTEELKSLYAGKLEDIFATLFRQIIFTNFERDVHSHDGELEVEDLCKYWKDENQKMFGDSLELTDEYSIFWSYIPHFIHSPFYCYAYSYGQLLVLTLYGLYKSEHKDFIPKYKKFLSSGGSDSPKKLLESFGLDIDDGEFWQIGINEAKKILTKFEKLV
ncbi:MAG: Oligoendopeptidase F (EC [uncultured Campylobacterales bacterium]|uniref:Oligoendopeptidase F (EC) n=1 Tax=uncultured Campylobacterales bacterium TaxID=352960 RepID=A0A6S6SZV9_9BACT|nr:MAG: Oligoendopeptidase F (EC [uncultured Campylobacterales bacterium]